MSAAIRTQLDRVTPATAVAKRAPFVAGAPLADPAEVSGPPLPAPALDLPTGLGGFASGGREYVVTLDGADDTPMPWANVIANPRFGTIVTTSGAAHTWASNSREHRLTPFANDPVLDPTAEAIFVRDEASGEIWSPTPGPLFRDAARPTSKSDTLPASRSSRAARPDWITPSTPTSTASSR